MKRPVSASLSEEPESARRDPPQKSNRAVQSSCAGIDPPQDLKRTAPQTDEDRPARGLGVPIRLVERAGRHIRVMSVYSDEHAVKLPGPAFRLGSDGGKHGTGAALHDDQIRGIVGPLMEITEPPTVANRLTVGPGTVPLIVAEHEDVGPQRTPAAGTGGNRFRGAHGIFIHLYGVLLTVENADSATVQHCR